MILALDISSTCTGIAIIDNQGKIVYSEVLLLKHYEDIFQKGDYVRREMVLIEKSYSISAVFIEEPLMSFKSGFSSAQVISLLNRFNGMVSLICYETFGITPEYINASSARKMNDITIHRGENSKQKVLDHLLLTDDSFVVEYTKKGNPKPGTFDRADALIVARAGLKLLNDSSRR